MSNCTNIECDNIIIKYNRYIVIFLFFFRKNLILSSAKTLPNFSQDTILLYTR